MKRKDVNDEEDDDIFFFSSTEPSVTIRAPAYTINVVTPPPPIPITVKSSIHSIIPKPVVSIPVTSLITPITIKSFIPVNVKSTTHSIKPVVSVPVKQISTVINVEEALAVTSSTPVSVTSTTTPVSVTSTTTPVSVTPTTTSTPVTTREVNIVSSLHTIKPVVSVPVKTTSTLINIVEKAIPAPVSVTVTSPTPVSVVAPADTETINISSSLHTIKPVVYLPVKTLSTLIKPVVSVPVKQISTPIDINTPIIVNTSALPPLSVVSTVDVSSVNNSITIKEKQKETKDVKIKNRLHKINVKNSNWGVLSYDNWYRGKIPNKSLMLIMNKKDGEHYIRNNGDYLFFVRDEELWVRHFFNKIQPIPLFETLNKLGYKIFQFNGFKQNHIYFVKYYKSIQFETENLSDIIEYIDLEELYNKLQNEGVINIANELNQQYIDKKKVERFLKVREIPLLEVSLTTTTTKRGRKNFNLITEEDKAKEEQEDRRAKEEEIRAKEEEIRAKEQEEIRAKEQEEIRAKEQEEIRVKEQEERRAKEEEERRAKEEEERRAKEEEERREERRAKEEEIRAKEQEERRAKEQEERRAKEEEISKEEISEDEKNEVKEQIEKLVLEYRSDYKLDKIQVLSGERDIIEKLKKKQFIITQLQKADDEKNEDYTKVLNEVQRRILNRIDFINNRNMVLAQQSGMTVPEFNANKDRIKFENQKTYSKNVELVSSYNILGGGQTIKEIPIVLSFTNRELLNSEKVHLINVRYKVDDYNIDARIVYRIEENDVVKEHLIREHIKQSNNSLIVMKSDFKFQYKEGGRFYLIFDNKQSIFRGKIIRYEIYHI